ncbi:hypothetical protein PRIPAC_78441 [Pristionchus pacificus]|uniref:Uncharacterized protein n=1 Tax=Pristionchus pacificus TaxID=54126 RepID=A0A2A6CJT4_PRIPA|nr:hypothetical protein PRIPAC_78441 [Pristionchus pacificus]|eukprot:PDM78485.1 hypothetical protein PRIPAC_31064 [Pristionchus pacificus]
MHSKSYRSPDKLRNCKKRFPAFKKRTLYSSAFDSMGVAALVVSFHATIHAASLLLTTPAFRTKVYNSIFDGVGLPARGVGKPTDRRCTCPAGDSSILALILVSTTLYFMVNNEFMDQWE